MSSAIFFKYVAYYNFEILQIVILLYAYECSLNIVIYVFGGEVLGGQKTLIPFHAIFENDIDRTFGKGHLRIVT